MTTDFRALCVELTDCLEKADWPHRYKVVFQQWMDIAHAALAEPEPKGPTDEDLQRLMYFEFTTSTGHGERVDEIGFARAVLDRWGRPAAAPVPVSERLPAAGEWVWHCYAEVRFWEHGRYNGRQFFIGDGPESQPATHWLPANALPLPAPEGG